MASVGTVLLRVSRAGTMRAVATVFFACFLNISAIYYPQPIKIDLDVFIVHNITELHYVLEYSSKVCIDSTV